MLWFFCAKLVASGTLVTGIAHKKHMPERHKKSKKKQSREIFDMGFRVSGLWCLRFLRDGEGSGMRTEHHHTMIFSLHMCSPHFGGVAAGVSQKQFHPHVIT